MAKVRRTLSISNLHAKKHEAFELEGALSEVLGSPEKGGCWIVWGNEKNGKTWLILLLANYLSEYDKVHFISAEEGTGRDFSAVCIRAKISPANKNLHIIDYETIEELSARLRMRRSARIVIIDNITVYNEELKNGVVRQLLKEFPDVLFIFLAHEERGEPYTATAKLVKRLAKVIIYVHGLAADVSGRCPGGRLIINEDKAALYHGQGVN
jgi:hypothetical protein